MAGRIYIGTAGWSVPRASSHRCPSEGTHLQRYARLFPCVEVNSSFYRSHSPMTYSKWAASTSEEFRFAVKLPRLITHEQLLRRSQRPFEQFVTETNGLGSRRGPLLVQLPPSFAFDGRVAARFFEMVRRCYDGIVVCEPRHPTWSSVTADGLLSRYAVARVAAHPAITETSFTPGGWTGVAYFRLHGAPRTYWSRYHADCLWQLAVLAQQIARSVDVWCVFDNTASGAAIENAWELRHSLLNLAPCF